MATKQLLAGGSGVHKLWVFLHGYVYRQRRKKVNMGRGEKTTFV
jgi:hypothetical protein